jgi:PIN domain nuclease of toxin-antitoxin system
VTDALLLDTRIALWLDSGDDRLRASTRALIDRCWQNGGTIFLSAVTVWEIALLVDTGRIDLDIPVEGWVERFLDRPGIEGSTSELPSSVPRLSAARSGASRSGGSPSDFHGDRACLSAGHV